MNHLDVTQLGRDAANIGLVDVVISQQQTETSRENTSPPANDNAHLTLVAGYLWNNNVGLSRWHVWHDADTMYALQC